MNETFIPSLSPEFFYNNSTQYEEGYLADTPNAWLLGVARLRQLRIKKGKILNVFREIFCQRKERSKTQKGSGPIQWGYFFQTKFKN